MAEAIEARRLERGLSPTDFAKAAGITIQGLGPVRNGIRRKYMHKVKVGVARALWWPDDAIDRLMAGVDPATFETVQPVADGLESEVAERLRTLDQQVAALRDEIKQLQQQRSGGARQPKKTTRPNGK